MRPVELLVPGKSLGVTALGILTLLAGAAYTMFGGAAVLGGVSWLSRPQEKDPWSQVISLGGLLPAFIAVFGAVFLVFGLFVLLAGLGVLLRKRWGWILTLLAAIAAILLGFLWLSGVHDVSADATDLTIGVAQLVYGTVAFVLLIMKRAVFFSARA